MKVLVANRGEIACRVLRTLNEMGLASTAVYTDVDRDALHPFLASDAVALGPADRYLDARAILEAAKKTGATAVHPGYGFLSQSSSFARRCTEAGVIFLGPTAESMEALGDKRGSRRTAERLGIPVVPGAQEADGLAAAEEAAARLGYPILLKAAGGGGGRGMRLVRTREEMKESHDSARREARAAFADDRLIVEKYIHPARHVEIQILGNGKDTVALGDRECSLQRRYQKVIEEAPAASVPAATRLGMADAAVRLGRETGYRSAGTVEFLVSADGSYYFLEVNTRLQVEHPVTEMLTGMDVVRSQVEVAQGAPLPAPVEPRGHAIEARLNAEDPYRDFLPQTGTVRMLEWPNLPGVRVDTGLREGGKVTSDYDSLLAKIIACGNDREHARRRLVEALRETVLLGVITNQSLLLQVLESSFFRAGETFTTTLESTAWSEPEVPEEIAAAARRILSVPGQGAADGAGVAIPSPWDTMKQFRVGS